MLSLDAVERKGVERYLVFILEVCTGKYVTHCSIESHLIKNAVREDGIIIIGYVFIYLFIYLLPNANNVKNVHDVES